MIYLELMVGIGGLLVFLIGFIFLRNLSDDAERRIEEVLILIGFLLYFSYNIGIHGIDLIIPSHQQEITVRASEIQHSSSRISLFTRYYIKGENGEWYQVSSAQKEKLQEHHVYKLTYYKLSNIVIDFEEIKDKEEERQEASS